VAVPDVPPSTPRPASSPAENLRQLLEDRILPAHRSRWGDSGEWPALLDFQRQLAAARWTAPGWPVENEGRGLGVMDQVACEAVFRELAAPTRVAVYGVNNVGPTIAAYGTVDQKRHLRAIVNVEEVWCQGFSEPGAGSDLAALRTTAVTDGDGWVISGQKVWTSIGMNATHCMVLARTDPTAAKHRGITAFLVPLDSAGITRRPIKQINGEVDFAEVFYDEVRVSATSVLGPVHDGWRVTMTTLGYERAGVLAMAAQLAGDAEATVREVAAAGRLGGAALDRGMSLWIEGRLLQATGERSLGAEGPGPLSTLIKLAWSQLGQQLTEFRLDALGPAGMTDGDSAHRFVSSRMLSIAGGTTEVLRNLIAERVLGLPKEP
jgi:3-oxochol-4-en-24-oyl-CoA dehydrogenase